MDEIKKFMANKQLAMFRNKFAFISDGFSDETIKKQLRFDFVPLSTDKSVFARYTATLNEVNTYDNYLMPRLVNQTYLSIEL